MTERQAYLLCDLLEVLEPDTRILGIDEVKAGVYQVNTWRENKLMPKGSYNDLREWLVQYAGELALEGVYATPLPEEDEDDLCDECRAVREAEAAEREENATGKQ
jgi:hypothetical protein